MKSVKCPTCGAKMVKNGRTSAGTQRWRCGICGGSSTVHYDDTATRLNEFLAWLMSKNSQTDMPGQGRTFRRKTAEFWKLWPLPIPDGEVHRVLFVDGIWLSRNLIVLICCSEERVVSWYMVQAETSAAWQALLSPIPAPDVVVTDGGSDFAKALKKVWPRTRIQRCVFHAFCQVKRYTTSKPRLQAGRELYALAVELLHIENLKQADWWVERYLEWCRFWVDFLEETTVIDGKREFTHERLRKARSSLSRLVSAGTLFTYLDYELTVEGSLPATNNRIEGLNSQLRALLRNHRGLSELRRVKVVFWWCHLHSGDQRTAAEKLASMPTDKDVDFLFKTYSVSPKRGDGGPEWGTRVVWEELHKKDPYPFWID